MIQKIKCFFGWHKVMLKTQLDPTDIFNSGKIIQHVQCKNCNKVFLTQDWSKLPWN